MPSKPRRCPTTGLGIGGMARVAGRSKPKSSRRGSVPEPRAHLTPDVFQTDVCLLDSIIAPGPALAPEAALHAEPFRQASVVAAETSSSPIPFQGYRPLPF